MLIELLHKNYCACLRLKMGEYTALSSLDEFIKDRLLPYFIAPPPQDKDPERGRRLTQTELLTDTAKRIGKHWPLRPAMLDTSYIADALGTMEAHIWLPGLFDSIRRYHGNCIPVLSLESTSSERIGAKKIFEKYNGYIGIRIVISHVDDPRLSKKIYEIVNVVGCGAGKAIIVLDCEDMKLDPIVDSYPTIENALDLISSMGRWAKMIFVATSYPDSNPAKQNGNASIDRYEFDIWKSLFEKSDFSKLNVIFGDYGADCALIDFSKRKIRKTIAHLRFTTENSIKVFRGGKNLGKEDDGTIRSVARKIVNSEDFPDNTTSIAEEFILDCADGTGPPGNATTWRKINTIRHITCTVRSLSDLVGTTIPSRPQRVKLKQNLLFEDQN